MIYLDSSALVKRYIEEAGSDKINALLQENTIVATSRLAYPEILSAITRRHKAGDIATLAFEETKKAFRADWSFFAVVELRLEVLQFVDRIIDRHARRLPQRHGDTRRFGTADSTPGRGHLTFGLSFLS